MQVLALYFPWLQNNKEKKITKNKKKKHNKIVMLAKCKLKSIEKIISQTLIDVGISHEELKTTINEENY